MTPRPWRMVALLCATATASYLCRVNMSVTGALLMGEFHLSQIAMGRVFSAFVLGYALAQIPAGMLADRWGARRVLLASAWVWGIATVLQAGGDRWRARRRRRSSSCSPFDSRWASAKRPPFLRRPRASRAGSRPAHKVARMASSWAPSGLVPRSPRRSSPR